MKGPRATEGESQKNETGRSSQKVMTQSQTKTSPRKGLKWSHLHRDFLKTKRNHSQQEKTKRTLRARRNFLKMQRAAEAERQNNKTEKSSSEQPNLKRVKA